MSLQGAYCPEKSDAIWHVNILRYALNNKVQNNNLSVIITMTKYSNGNTYLQNDRYCEKS